MTQQHVDSPSVIYDSLVASEDLEELIGTRVFEVGNTELAAISIVTPGAELPKLKRISGLEIVIHDVARLGRRDYISEASDITTSWRVFLLAWPPANGETLNEAARLIMGMFTKATAIEVAPVPQGLGAIAQIQIIIPSDSVVLNVPELEV